MVQTSAQNIRSMASQLNREVYLFIFFFYCKSSRSSGSKHMLQLITAMVTCPGRTLHSKLNIFNKINLKLHLGLDTKCRHNYMTHYKFIFSVCKYVYMKTFCQNVFS